MESYFRKDLLEGKVSFITGGGSGINYGIAETYAAHCCTVVIMGRRKNVIEAAARKLNQTFGVATLGIQGDVRKEEDAKRAIDTIRQKFGRLDILINGAAGNFLCLAEDLSLNAFKTVVEIDLIGSFNVSKQAFPLLKETSSKCSTEKLGRGASIINITALLQTPATRYQTHAAAAKAGLDSLTRNLALEWGKYNIRVNGIAPGPIADTEGMKRLSGGEDLAKVRGVVPIGRLGSVHDIGQAALYLGSGASSFMSGDTLYVDGGSYLYSVPLVPDPIYQALKASRADSRAKL